ncbi:MULTISPECIES: acyl-CoA dehydrogenase family protein [Actinomycetes]|uniref:acyl-CoA dehydrogenase family protein n=1 Tax=Actinomycetes TaxID=1760 RepID=UPI0004C1BBF6|nr:MULTISPECIES: acyl-CoA dehydrogenase family protein [Actinomycetes]
MNTHTDAVVTTSADQSDLRDLARSIFRGPAAEALTVQKTSIPHDSKLWNTLTQSGLTLLTAREEIGGSGAGFDDAAVLIAAAAESAAPGPIAEADMLAAWLLDSAGLPVSHSPSTAAEGAVSLSDTQGETVRVSGQLDNVPWARDCEQIAVLADVGDRRAVLSVPVAQAVLNLGYNAAYEPRDHVAFDVEVPASAIVTVGDDVLREWSLRGAFIRSVQSCAAMRTALSLTIEHAGQRKQFGRPIGRFQAVQNMIAEAAGELAVAQAAVDTATRALVTDGFGSRQSEMTVAIAKAQSARASRVVSRNSHQVHGAIGFTLDHQLRHFTLKTLAWQQEFGGDRVWNTRVGELVAGRANSSIWDVVVAGLTD